MRGQEFASIKLIIAAAFAAALLLTVVSISGFLKPSPDAARDMKQMLASALSSRDQCIKRDVYYTKGTVFSPDSLAKLSGAQSVSFRVKQEYSGAFNTGSGLEPLYSVKAPASVSCDPGGTCVFCVGSSKCDCP